MRACWLKWVGRDWSISADYIWLNYSGANTPSSGFLSHDGFSAELGMLLSAFGLLPVLTRMMPR